MARRYYKRSYRRRGPSWTVQRKVLQFSSFTQNTADPQNWNASILLAETPSDSGNNTINHGNKTIKHIDIQLMSRPIFKVQTQFANQFNYVNPSCAWLVVHVPDGYNLNEPFVGGSISQISLYEPSQNVLAAGVIPGTNSAYINENVAGEEAVFDGALAAGNVTRLRVPVSKTLRPGDKIALIMATTDMAFGDLRVDVFRPGRIMCKYAIKYN